MNDFRHSANAEGELDQVQLRIHGPSTAPVLVYLPGLHGDWTLVGGFRRAIARKVKFVEITYPRTRFWSLQDYASQVTAALAKHEVTGGWLLGESFGSQVVWEIVNQNGFRTEGVILAGGFGRHPIAPIAGAMAAVSGKASFKFIRSVFSVYAQVSKIRFRRSPETIASISEFVSRRTMEDWQAMRHRLRLVSGNNPAKAVKTLRVPVYALTGFWDPIVPWYPAGRWLKKNCGGFSGHRIVRSADHNVLGTAPAAAAAQVWEWMTKPPKRGLAGSGDEKSKP